MGHIGSLTIWIICMSVICGGCLVVHGMAIESTNGDENRERIQIQEQVMTPFKSFLNDNHPPSAGYGSRSSNSRNAIHGPIGTSSGSSSEWENVLDPKLYIITEYKDTQSPHTNNNNEMITEGDEGSMTSGGHNMEDQMTDNEELTMFPRHRRYSGRGANGVGNGHSLSIVNAIDVLRQKTLMEMGRLRNQKQQQQIIANAEFLRTIG